MAQLQAVQQFNITDHVSGGKNSHAHTYTHSRTYWMYLSETFWLCLVVMVRMYICSAASRSAASYFSSGPNRSKHTSLQLCREKAGKQSFTRRLFFFRACEECFICPRSSSGSRSASSLSWMKFSAFVARESFKGIQFPVLDEGLGSTKRWNLTGKKKKKKAFLLPGYLTWLIIKRILWGREKSFIEEQL